MSLHLLVRDSTGGLLRLTLTNASETRQLLLHSCALLIDDPVVPFDLSEPAWLIGTELVNIGLVGMAVPANLLRPLSGKLAQSVHLLLINTLELLRIDKLRASIECFRVEVLECVHDLLRVFLMADIWHRRHLDFRLDTSQ